MKRLAVKESGKTVTWKMSRPDKDTMTGSGSSTYAGDSHTGVSTMTTSHGGQAMTMTRRKNCSCVFRTSAIHGGRKYNARRLGDRR